jgi:glycosyltransferase involved in cell wall biosynthesis
VAHLTPAPFGPGGVYGGAERYTLELARHMARVVPTTLVTFADAPTAYTTADGLRVTVLGPSWRVRGQPFNRLHPGLVRAVAAADVVHCHQPHTLAAELAAVLARLGRRSAVATDLGGGGWGLNGYANTEPLFRRHLHISEYSRRLAGHAAAEVIYGGVDTDLFSPDPAVPAEPLAAYVGRLVPHKGVDDLIAALPEGMGLEVIGRAYHARYAADLRRLAAGKRVTFRDGCDDAELVRAYRRAAVVVLPSVYRDRYGGESRVPELLGQTLLEGMACGTPGLTTAVASLPEVVADGETGWVVPANDPAALRAKLEWVRDHPAEARAVGAAGRRRVLDRFTWPAVVDRCLRAYRCGC